MHRAMAHAEQVTSDPSLGREHDMGKYSSVLRIIFKAAFARENGRNW